jgi:hypothetical protein
VWFKLGGHPCWRVQKELDAAGADYEIVKGPLRRSKRDNLERLTGQRMYPAIEFEDGAVYREQAADMAETIKAGKLAEKDTAAAPAASAPPEAETKEWPAQS